MDTYETLISDLPCKNDVVKPDTLGTSTGTIETVNPVVKGNTCSDLSFIDKIKTMLTQKNINIMIILGVLYIILTSDFYMDTISKYLTFITVNDNKFNTIGSIITAILIGVMYILSKTFTSF